MTKKLFLFFFSLESIIHTVTRKIAHLCYHHTNGEQNRRYELLLFSLSATMHGNRVNNDDDDDKDDCLYYMIFFIFRFFFSKYHPCQLPIHPYRSSSSFLLGMIVRLTMIMVTRISTMMIITLIRITLKRLMTTTTTMMMVTVMM